MQASADAGRKGSPEVLESARLAGKPLMVKYFTSCLVEGLGFRVEG